MDAPREPASTSTSGASAAIDEALSAAALALFGLRVEPTIMMERGQQKVFQCAHCGTTVVQSSLAPGKLGACPACGQGKWWQQKLPVSGIHEIDGRG
ncbi:hypothetical protein [Agromyces humi]|uniref:hypothetical protein n=1 Tax=Agromyces humi TaxID=1766800 RepID=UPI00135B3E3D|nr:hypothetical protein [Agromyces humi]